MVGLLYMLEASSTTTSTLLRNLVKLDGNGQTFTRLPKTNIASENGWLEDDRFLLGPGIFSGAFVVSFSEGNSLEVGTSK